MTWSVVLHPQPRPQAGRVLTVVPPGVEPSQAEGDVVFLTRPATLEDAAQARAQVLVGSDAPLPEARLRSWLVEQTPVQAGELTLEAQQQLAPHARCDALDLRHLPRLDERIDGLTAAVTQHPEAAPFLYGHVLAARSDDGFDFGSPGFDRRDAGSFLRHVAGDERLPQAVRQAAGEAFAALDDLTLGEQFPTVRLPWRLDRQAPLEGSWGRLAEAIHAQPGPAVAPVRGLIGVYQRYVSPELDSGCTGKPSCSQYTKEAIAEHGLVEGAKLGFMRLVACTDTHPGHEVTRPRPVGPPPVRDKSVWRRACETGLVATARALGTVVGGAVGALLALPVGATLGFLAGSGRLAPDPARYGEKSVKALENLLAPAAAAGPLLGTLLGAAGAVVKGGHWGGLFAGLAAQNLTREAFGELPPAR